MRCSVVLFVLCCVMWCGVVWCGVEWGWGEVGGEHPCLHGWTTWPWHAWGARRAVQLWAGLGAHCITPHSSGPAFALHLTPLALPLHYTSLPWPCHCITPHSPAPAIALHLTPLPLPLHYTSLPCPCPGPPPTPTTHDPTHPPPPTPTPHDPTHPPPPTITAPPL